MDGTQGGMGEWINIYIILVDTLQGRTLHRRSCGGRGTTIKSSLKT